jgi:dipeptidyl aminopeptidase/acylaminoacyl peptidase
VLATTPNESPALVGWASDGRSIFFTEIRHTTMVLGVLPVDGTSSRDVTQGPTAVGPLTLSPGARWLALGEQSWEEPEEISITRLPADSSTITAGSLQIRRITRVNAAFGRLAAPRQEVVDWTSDGRTIEGFLTYPVGYQAGRRYPLLLYVHGGPTGAFLNAYAGMRDIYPVAVLAQRGYAVLRVNPRGSDGYGGEFRKANIQDFGGGDYRDLMRGVDSVIAQGVADPSRLGIMGWSYGGFMTAWTTTQTDRFLAASVGAGPVDWTSMAGTDDLPLLVPDFFGGLPWQVPDDYTRRSPVTFAAGVKTPTLIQHGMCDTRVPYSQGQEWFFTLKGLGVPVTWVSYPRSGHVVVEPGLVRDTFQRNLDWFARYVPVN